MGRILVVEDNQMNCDVALLQLKALGIEADSAENGFDAIEAVKNKQYAAILMDVMMPEPNGWDACRTIREYEKTIGRHTPIIGLSAWSAADNKQRCLEAGMDDYLSKPYNREQLRTILALYIQSPDSVPKN